MSYMIKTAPDTFLVCHFLHHRAPSCLHVWYTIYSTTCNSIYNFTLYESWV